MGIADPAGQGQPVGDLEIDLTEDREVLVLHPVGLEPPLARCEELVEVAGGLARHRAEQALQTRDGLGAAAQSGHQRIGIGARSGAPGLFAVLFDFLVEIEGAEQDIDLIRKIGL